MKATRLAILAASLIMSMDAPLVSTTATAAAPAEPDLVILNAVVRTLDPARPEAEAIAVAGNQIVAVGSTAEMRKAVKSGTKVVDAGGRLVLPGFNDAHLHFLSGGFHLAGVNLREAKSPQELAEQLRRHVEKVSAGRWVTGGDWDHELWPGAPLPTKEQIDPGTPGTPVLVNRLDGHMALANSVALKLAGITAATKDPPGGLIVRDARTGEPTGVLKDAAMDLVSSKIPPPTFEEKLAAAALATDHAASLGVTSVQDMSAGEEVRVYEALHRQGRLKTRIYGMAPLRAWETIDRQRFRPSPRDAMVRTGGLKAFSDGSLGSTTAHFFEPYSDTPDTRGLASDEMLAQEDMIRRAREADREGFQLMIHAIGDRANDAVLSLFDRVRQLNGPRDRRFRIEHAQHLRPGDIPRFKGIGVIASMQPYHCADDGRWAEKRIGKARCETTYAFRLLLDTGTALAFGSDWTVAPLNPLLGIAAAVTRRTLDGKNPDGWIPSQKITVEETVRAYTVGSAYAEFQEGIKGTIAPGMLADIVMLDRNIFLIPPAEIEKARVVFTVVNGRIVWK